jgi:hypothetical protein
MFATRIIKSSLTVLALALFVSCGKKEEKVTVAAPPQPTQAANLIDETKRSAEALKAQQAGTGAAPPPYSKLPDLLDQLAGHMDARAQARQQGADSSQAEAQITSDVTQLQEIQTNMSAFQPESENKPALDRVRENLTKVIEIVRQGQDLKAAIKGEVGRQSEASPSQSDFTQSDAPVASSGEPNPVTNEPGPAAETADRGNTMPGTSASAADRPSSAAAAPAEKMATASSGSACCTVVPNPVMKGRLGRLVVAYPAGTSAKARIGVMNGDKEVASGYGDSSFDLFPGSYSVVISGKRVDDVMVQSGHDTKVKVGVLRVTASSKTRIAVMDTDGKTEFASGYGEKQFGLPIGTAHVMVSGHSEPVTIKDGQVTDF